MAESKHVTPNDARHLVERLSTLIREHGELQAEVLELRESLRLFSDLRELLDTAPAVSHAMHNGYIPHRSMTVPAGDRPGVESPALDDVSSDDADDGPVVDALDDDPAASHRDDSQQDAGDRAGVETIGPGDDPAEDAGDVPPPPPEPSSVETEPGENTPSPPPAPGTLMEKIFDLIDQSPRPKRAWQIEKELALARLPHAELSRMVAQGHLERLREGVYGIAGRSYSAVAPSEGSDV